jgi:hypothetical protein
VCKSCRGQWRGIEGRRARWLSRGGIGLLGGAMQEQRSDASAGDPERRERPRVRGRATGCTGGAHGACGVLHFDRFVVTAPRRRISRGGKAYRGVAKREHERRRTPDARLVWRGDYGLPAFVSGIRFRYPFPVSVSGIRSLPNGRRAANHWAARRPLDRPQAICAAWWVLARAP